MAPHSSSRVASNLVAPSQYSQTGAQEDPWSSPPSTFIMIRSRGTALAQTCARMGLSDQSSRTSLCTMQACLWCDANA
eukprot:617058-Prymnesium_polylepis.1